MSHAVIPKRPQILEHTTFLFSARFLAAARSPVFSGVAVNTQTFARVLPAVPFTVQGVTNSREKAVGSTALAHHAFWQRLCVHCEHVSARVRTWRPRDLPAERGKAN